MCVWGGVCGVGWGESDAHGGARASGEGREGGGGSALTGVPIGANTCETRSFAGYLASPPTGLASHSPPGDDPGTAGGGAAAEPAGGSQSAGTPAGAPAATLGWRGEPTYWTTGTCSDDGTFGSAGYPCSAATRASTQSNASIAVVCARRARFSRQS